jgi:hypothetical protein
MRSLDLVGKTKLICGKHEIRKFKPEDVTSFFEFATKFAKGTDQNPKNSKDIPERILRKNGGHILTRNFFSENFSLTIEPPQCAEQGRIYTEMRNVRELIALVKNHMLVRRLPLRTVLEHGTGTARITGTLMALTP